MLLGVNIDHIATLREARKINEPNPLEAVFVLKNAGANQVTLHLREDRRHIHDEDLFAIAQASILPLNLECAMTQEMIDIACQIKPHRVTLVPEKREEITTEGGLNLSHTSLSRAIKTLQDYDIEVSLFIDPTLEAISKSLELGVQYVELHTGEWANLFLMSKSNFPRTHHSIPSLNLPRSKLQEKLTNCLTTLKACANYGKNEGLEIYAGHGLNYQNVLPLVAIEDITELNIGHSIIARAVFVGLVQAIQEMKALIKR